MFLKDDIKSSIHLLFTWEHNNQKFFLLITKEIRSPSLSKLTSTNFVITVDTSSFSFTFYLLSSCSRLAHIAARSVETSSSPSLKFFTGHQQVLHCRNRCIYVEQSIFNKKGRVWHLMKMRKLYSNQHEKWIFHYCPVQYCCHRFLEPCTSISNTSHLWSLSSLLYIFDLALKITAIILLPIAPINFYLIRSGTIRNGSWNSSSNTLVISSSHFVNYFNCTLCKVFSQEAQTRLEWIILQAVI